MEKFIPYEKLSKKEKRKLDQTKRQTWGELNPVTRKPVSSNAYNRNKARNWKREISRDPVPGISFSFFISYDSNDAGIGNSCAPCLDFSRLPRYNTPRIWLLPPGSCATSIRLHIVRS